MPLQTDRIVNMEHMFDSDDLITLDCLATEYEQYPTEELRLRIDEINSYSVVEFRPCLGGFFGPNDPEEGRPILKPYLSSEFEPFTHDECTSGRGKAETSSALNLSDTADDNSVANQRPFKITPRPPEFKVPNFRRKSRKVIRPSTSRETSDDEGGMVTRSKGKKRKLTSITEQPTQNSAPKKSSVPSIIEEPQPSTSAPDSKEPKFCVEDVRLKQPAPTATSRLDFGRKFYRRTYVRTTAEAPKASTNKKIKRLKITLIKFDDEAQRHIDEVNSVRERNGLDRLPEGVRDLRRYKGEPVTYCHELTVDPARRRIRTGPRDQEYAIDPVSPRALPLDVSTQYNQTTRVFEQTGRLF